MSRWEGAILDGSGPQLPFWWEVGEGGALSGEWSVYNRTWPFSSSNESAPATWRAERNVEVRAGKGGVRFRRGG